MNQGNIFASYQFNIKRENFDKYYLFRYFQNITRLRSFLEDGIYMTRSDKFTDHLECIDFKNLLKINRYKDYVKLLPEHNLYYSIEELSSHIRKSQDILDDLAIGIQKNQQKYHISCWYISQNEIENELMWKSYGKDYKNNSKGFLIKISLKDFLSNLEQISFLNDCYSKITYGSVAYYNFEDKEIKKLKYTGFRKHLAFKDESEFRLIYKNHTQEIKEHMFLKLPNSFYADLTIIAHPEYDEIEYHELRKEFEDSSEKSIELSDLYIWYKLKKRIKSTL